MTVGKKKEKEDEKQVILMSISLKVETRETHLTLDAMQTLLHSELQVCHRPHAG